MKELQEIQSKLVAPKGQFNSFGKYAYRNAEDILKAVKPLANEAKVTIKLTDEVVAVADRIYVKATAVMKNESGEIEESVGWARESLNKKGMDDSQITGSASSYARKYALNGLLAIDDTKDADHLQNGQEKQPQAPKQQRNQNVQQGGGFPQKKSANPLNSKFAALFKQLMFKQNTQDEQIVYDGINGAFATNIASLNDFAELPDNAKNDIVSNMEAWVNG